MNQYQEVLDYMFSALPMFHRIGVAAYKANLDNTHALMEYLHHPETKFKAIHIAGTNGKGSTSHMLASIFQEAGYKTGLYTSPHLRDFRERIRINGEMIPEEKVITFVNKHKAFFDTLHPSFFEMTVGLAFNYFANEKVDIAIIETGLGGRLDSTNIILPEIAVITNIGKDHTQFLGDTLEKIASEKAGIIKPGIPVVIGETHPETEIVFHNKASECNSPLLFADQKYRIVCNDYHSESQRTFLSMEVLFPDGSVHYFESELSGIYQTRNILTALAAAYELKSKGWRLSEKAIENGIRHAATNTGLMGRWQILGQKPLTVCDTAHNVHGIVEVLKQLEKIKFQKLHIVFGMVDDKDISGVLELMPKEAIYYFCKAGIPRAMDAQKLATIAGESGLSGKTCTTVNDALQQAREQAQPNDMIYIGGSTFVVAEVV